MIVADCLTSLAVILLEEKKPLEAQALLKENVLPIYDELCGPDSLHSVYVKGLLGLCANAEIGKAGSGTEEVVKSIVHLLSVSQLSKEHAYVKILRHGDPSASQAAEIVLTKKFGDAQENKFTITVLQLPTDAEIKMAENITEQSLSVTFIATQDLTGTTVIAPSSPGADSVISDITVTREPANTTQPEPVVSVRTSPQKDVSVEAQNKTVASLTGTTISSPVRASTTVVKSQPTEISQNVPEVQQIAQETVEIKSTGPTLAAILSSAIPDAPGSLPNLRDNERSNSRAKGAEYAAQPIESFSNRLPKLGRRNGPSNFPEDMSKSIPNLGSTSSKAQSNHPPVKQKPSATQRFVTNSLDGEFPLATTITGGTITKSGPPLSALQATENALNERPDSVIGGDMNIADMLNHSQQLPPQEGNAAGCGVTTQVLASPAPSSNSIPATRYPNLRGGLSSLKSSVSKSGPTLAHLSPTSRGSSSMPAILFSQTLPAGDPSVLSGEDILKTMQV